MSDFIEDGLVELDVLGRVFKIKEKDGREVDVMRDKSYKMDDDGKVTLDLVKQNPLWLACVVEAPYPEWKDAKDKVAFLNKLKSQIRTVLLNKIRSYHNGLSDTEKK